MKIALTGATGFLGRYIVDRLTRAGHDLRCWFRPTSDRSGFEEQDQRITWIEGDLRTPASAANLVDGCDAVIHSALERPHPGFMGAEGDVPTFVERNVVGAIRLIEEARSANVGRFVFISTCAVHDVILGDRPLDETHPLWPKSHYGAHKAAIEAFVHSYGRGEGYPICAIRPTGIYGLARPVADSKWFDLIGQVVRGEDVVCKGGGKEVHAADVAHAIEILLSAEGIAGQSYNCYDLYVSQYDVATIARELSGSSARILGEPPFPKHVIMTDKLRSLGMQFGGRPQLKQTVQELVEAHRDKGAGRSAEN